MSDFSHFVAIDWSGAKALPSYRHKLQMAVCETGTAPPKLVTPPSGFSRADICEALAGDYLKKSSLIGFDFSFAPPFIDAGAFLPGTATPKSGKAFWGFVDQACLDSDFGAASFVEQHHRGHFYLGKADGIKSRLMRLRRCEITFNAQGGGKPSSIFDCVGAAQVSKASFAGMRVLHQLAPHAPIWPFDSRPASGALIVEIYCRAFIRHAGLRGLKIRDLDTLNGALKALGSAPVAARNLPNLTDDMTDALISAAGLRLLSQHPEYWAPDALTKKIAHTEGWTFGVR
jgi:hypothetical protein